MVRSLSISRAFALVSAALLALAVSACAPGKADNGPMVFAAASLQEALEDAADAWAAKGHPRPVLAFAGTPTLARQIEAGAPADLFISADAQWMDALENKRLIDKSSRATLARNRLVLIAARDSDIDLRIAQGFALEAALGDGKLAMADPDAVPAGRYARTALIRLSAWPRSKRKIIRTENVRVALALVARGEAPLGIVYATDAESEPGVRVLGTFPESTHAPITYPLAVLQSASPPDARVLRDFLLSAEAQAIFARHGFGTGDAP